MGSARRLPSSCLLWASQLSRLTGKPGPVRKTANPLSAKPDHDLGGLYRVVDTEGSVVIERRLPQFPKGRESLQVETLWERTRPQDRPSRPSRTLWDLRETFFGGPVNRLLGSLT